MIIHSKQYYGRDASNRISQTKRQGIEGARALIESFYYAFNQRDMCVFSQVWADHALIQLNNPLGGILRSYESVSNLYQNIFNSSTKVWVGFNDIVEFQTDDMVVFAGRETGEFTSGKDTISLEVRTSRVAQWLGVDAGWKQTHHHGSIDNPYLLAEYQQAASK